MGNWPGRPSPERRKELDKALNEIMIWVCDNLPQGWYVGIDMIGGEDGKGEASLELRDPDGETVSDQWDSEQRNIWTMVDHANNPGDPDVFPSEDED